MNTPAVAIAWQLWRRHRWGLAAEFTYLFSAAIVVQLLPSMLRGSPLSESDIPIIAHSLAIPCIFILIHIIAMFSFASPDAKDTGYISYLFVLPVSTRMLATWPMLFGCLALALVWLLVVLMVLRPGGIHAPLWWPCAALAVLLTGIQALSWTPLKQSWLRIFLAVPTLVLLFALGALLVIYEVPEAVIFCISLALLPPIYLVAREGVARSRRGDAFDWRGWQRLIERLAAWRKPAEHPFSSAAVAQMWFEWRGVGWTLPTMVCAFLPWFVPIIFTNASDVAVSWRFLLMVLCLPAFTAFLMGSAAGKQDVWSKYDASTFVLTRPISTDALVRAKFLSAGFSALVANLPALLILPLLLLRPGFLDSITQAVQSTPALHAAVVMLLFAVAPIVATWLGLVANMWMGLSGRTWIVNTVPTTIVVLCACFAAIVFWVYLHPEWHADALAAAPWGLASLVAIKLIAAGGAMIALARSGLVATEILAWAAAAWSMAVAGLLSMTLWLMPSEIASPMVLLGAIILVVPITRLAAAPLALAWNRHR